MIFPEINHIFEPTPLQCGQAVLSMLTSKPIEEIISICGTDRETTLADMFKVLDFYGIKYNKIRSSVESKETLPKICILSLETPRCWHWSLYFDGTFFDPEHGVLKDFPQSNRRYFWEVYEDQQ